MTKVSAIMALYNTPFELLDATVKSILNQSFNDFEFIVIDDASSIEYKEYFNSYHDKRLKYYKLEKNAGPGNARNEGIKKAIGEYIAIVDSDDVYKSYRFQKQVEFFDANSDISLLSGGFKFSNNGRDPKVIETDEDIKVELLFNSQFANPLVMFRKNIFVEKGLFYPENINFGEDYQLWIDAMIAGIKMANLQDILMIYTRHKNQLSKTKEDQQIFILKSIYKKMLSNFSIDATQDELDLHYKINSEQFNLLEPEDVSVWFDKIIVNNKIINNQKLLEKKSNVLAMIKQIKNRIFKLKIGGNNFCIYKPFEIKIEKRT